MILLIHTNSAFTHLIHTEVPNLAKIPDVRAAMEKYSSGYLTGARLDEAMKVGTLPMVSIEKLTHASSGEHREGKDRIVIDEDYVKGYVARLSSYVRTVPITVLHELTHWGYWSGQKSGHPSDVHGRDHQNHRELQSPLDPELYVALGWRIPTIAELP